MKKLQAFKYQLKISTTNARILSCIAGSCRFVYNKALDMQKKRYAAGEKKLTYPELCQALTVWKNDNELTWLNRSPSQALQQSLKDLERAYQNFFSKRADFPRFKKRGVRDSFRYPQGVKLDEGNNRIFLPKLGWVQYRNSREVEGDISNVTISRSCDKWYVSIQTEREVADVIHSSTTEVGMDVGVVRLATLSDETIFEAIDVKKDQKRLSAYQKKLSRKKKWSKNWKKAVTKVSRVHQKIRRKRENYLHQTSHIISKNHAMIYLEDLQIKNMTKSAKGSIETPGRNVKAKSGLNKAILTQGWYELRRQIEYKQLWRGGYAIAVPAKNTSRTCPECYYVSAENRCTQSLFVCMQCRYENHADLVGAINVARAGRARLACGETVQ